MYANRFLSKKRNSDFCRQKTGRPDHNLLAAISGKSGCLRSRKLLIWMWLSVHFCTVKRKIFTMVTISYFRLKQYKPKLSYGLTVQGLILPSLFLGERGKVTFSVMWNGNKNAELLIDAHISLFKQMRFKRKIYLQFIGFEKIMEGSTHFALPGFFNDLYILLRKNVRYQLGIAAISSKGS